MTLWRIHLNTATWNWNRPSNKMKMGHKYVSAFYIKKYKNSKKIKKYDWENHTLEFMRKILKNLLGKFIIFFVFSLCSISCSGMSLHCHQKFMDILCCILLLLLLVLEFWCLVFFVGWTLIGICQDFSIRWFEFWVSY